MKIKHIAAVAVIAVASVGSAGATTFNVNNDAAANINLAAVNPAGPWIFATEWVTPAAGSFSDIFLLTSDTSAQVYSAINSAWGVTISTSSFSHVSGNTWELDVSGSAVTGNGGFGVSFSGSPIVAVPEPETFAMLLAGLGLIGMVARRRNKAEAV